MKPLQVAFVAVLKPLQDVRLFRKLASCWLDVGFKVHLLGFQNLQDTPPKSVENVFFYPIFRRSRLHWSRLWVGYRVLWYLLKIRPQMVVCAAVEVLPFCLFYKLIAFLCLKRVHITYDVQENYFANILFTQTYPKAIRVVLATFVRFCEWLCSYGVDMFFLAEKCYQQELPFLGKKYVVAENKFIQADLQQVASMRLLSSKKEKCILHAGTIAKEYGIEQVLQIGDFLEKKSPDYRIRIIGKCSNNPIFNKLKKIKNKNITVEVSLTPVAYSTILEAYGQADIALMPYQINEAYKNRIPTKFYEAMAHNVWIWVQENPAWQSFFEEHAYRKVIFSDFWSGEADVSLLEKIDFSSDSIYSNPNIFWESEREKIYVWLQNVELVQKSSKNLEKLLFFKKKKIVL